MTKTPANGASQNGKAKSKLVNQIARIVRKAGKLGEPDRAVEAARRLRALEPNSMQHREALAELCLKQSIDVESVELIINATSTYVGDLRITLTSPRGTES